MCRYFLPSFSVFDLKSTIDDRENPFDQLTFIPSPKLINLISVLSFIVIFWYLWSAMSSDLLMPSLIHPEIGMTFFRIFLYSLTKHSSTDLRDYFKKQKLRKKPKFASQTSLFIRSRDATDTDFIRLPKKANKSKTIYHKMVILRFTPRTFFFSTSPSDIRWTLFIFA